MTANVITWPLPPDEMRMPRSPIAVVLWTHVHGPPSARGAAAGRDARRVHAAASLRVERDALRSARLRGVALRGRVALPDRSPRHRDQRSRALQPAARRRALRF